MPNFYQYHLRQNHLLLHAKLMPELSVIVSLGNLMPHLKKIAKKCCNAK